MDTPLIPYYEAIERASADMLEAARDGDWDRVVKLEGACMVLIGRLKLAAKTASLDAEGSRAKSRIMQSVLINDAEIRKLAEPWLSDIEQLMTGKMRTVH